MLQIYNTLSKTKEVFTPLVGNQVRMYVCGMTVYDYCHLGHGRSMVAFDVITRWLRHRGYDLTYVRNITDIDDKIINRANENGEPFDADRAHDRGDARGRGPAEHPRRTRSHAPPITSPACTR